MFCECRTATHELVTCEIYRCKECGAYIGEGQNHLERPHGGFVHVACTRRPSGRVATAPNDAREVWAGPNVLSSAYPDMRVISHATTGDDSDVVRRRSPLK